MYTYIHKYIHIYTHTHTHIYISVGMHVYLFRVVLAKGELRWIGLQAYLS